MDVVRAPNSGVRGDLRPLLRLVTESPPKVGVVGAQLLAQKLIDTGNQD